MAACFLPKLNKFIPQYGLERSINLANMIYCVAITVVGIMLTVDNKSVFVWGFLIFQFLTTISFLSNMLCETILVLKYSPVELRETMVGRFRMA